MQIGNTIFRGEESLKKKKKISNRKKAVTTFIILVLLWIFIFYIYVTYKNIEIQNMEYTAVRTRNFHTSRTNCAKRRTK